MFRDRRLGRKKKPELYSFPVNLSWTEFQKRIWGSVNERLLKESEWNLSRIPVVQTYRFDLTGLLKKEKIRLRSKNVNCLECTEILTSHYLMIEPFGIEGPVVMKKIQSQ